MLAADNEHADVVALLLQSLPSMVNNKNVYNTKKVSGNILITRCNPLRQG